MILGIEIENRQLKFHILKSKMAGVIYRASHHVPFLNSEK